MVKAFLGKLKIWRRNRFLRKELKKSLLGGTGTSTSKKGVLGLDDNKNQGDDFEVVFDETDYKYRQGMLQLKKAINERLDIKDGKSYEKLLSNFKGNKEFYLYGDLLELAKEQTENEKKLQEGRLAIISGKGADIKTEKDKEEMIAFRIREMYKVQDSKTKRKLLADIRKAHKQGETELAKKLEKEFYDRFTKIR